MMKLSTSSDVTYEEILCQAFPSLDTDAIRLLAATAEEKIFPKDGILCRQGETGTTLYVMCEGEAGIYVATDDETEVRVNVAQPFDYFGEMALLGQDTVRSATIRALTESRVLLIEQIPFLEVADQNPSLMRSLVVQLVDHLRNNDRAVIQELRHKNDELASAYADLAQQERMRREFVTTLSHEIRTPLTSVQGFLQLINKGMVKPESIPVALSSVTQNVEKLVHLTNNLLVLYEMQLTTPEFVLVNIPDLLLDALRKLQSSADYSEVDISVEIGTDIPQLRGDRAGLTLALHAIIENGAKFSNRESVHVRALPIMTEDGQKYVQIDVTDAGIGIPADMHERIFDPFYRLERPGGHQGVNDKLFDGVGIGLSIAKFIVERHNGRILVKSSPGKGSTFSLQLPR